MFKKNKNSMSYILKQRKKVIKKYAEQEPNYFTWRDELELDKFSTYIYITPRSIGKTYSGFDIAFETYEETGEYTVWMRTSLEEIKEIVNDYISNPPYPLPEYAIWKNKSIIDQRDGKIIMKFVALSTVHNLASITGSGVAFLLYDEFLPRTNRRLPRSYYKLTDFIKTLERADLLTVILQANATTLNSDILHHWDIWNDIDEKDDLGKRMKYRYYREWQNAPKVKEASTASLWASNTDELGDFFDKAEFLDDGDGGLVLPESRLGDLRYYNMFKLNGKVFTEALNNDNARVIVAGARNEGGIIYALTTEDGLTKGRYVRPLDIKQILTPIYYSLEQNNLFFASYELKDEVMQYLERIWGKIQKERK